MSFRTRWSRRGKPVDGTFSPHPSRTQRKLSVLKKGVSKTTAGWREETSRTFKEISRSYCCQWKFCLWVQNEHCLAYPEKTQNLDSVVTSFRHCWDSGSFMRTGIRYKKQRCGVASSHSYLFCPIINEETALGLMRKITTLVSSQRKCNITISRSLFGIHYPTLALHQVKSF